MALKLRKEVCHPPSSKRKLPKSRVTATHVQPATILVLLILPTLGCFFAIHYELSFFTNVILIYLVPGLYLTLRKANWRQAVHHITFALLVPFPFAFVVDYIGTVSGLWYVPHSFLPWRIYGVIPFEDFVWMACGVYTIITCYTFFASKTFDKLVPQKLAYFCIIAVAGVAIFFMSSAVYPELFVWHGKFAYLLLGLTFAGIPTVILIMGYRRAYAKVGYLIGYFLFLTFLLEYTETFLGQWVFHGNYIMQKLTFPGTPGIPYEELFFVGVVEVLVAVGFYSFFTDKKQVSRSR